MLELSHFRTDPIAWEKDYIKSTRIYITNYEVQVSVLSMQHTSTKLTSDENLANFCNREDNSWASRPAIGNEIIINFYREKWLRATAISNKERE